MDKKTHALYKNERFSIAYPTTYLSTEPYANDCAPKIVPNSTKNHPTTAFAFTTDNEHTTKESNKIKVKEGLKHMLSSDLFKILPPSTGKAQFKSKATTLSNSPKKYVECNYAKERASEIDKFSKLSSTKNSSNISQSKKESQNGSNYWASDMLQSKDSLPLSCNDRDSLDTNDAGIKRKHSKAQISVQNYNQFHYVPLNTNTFLSKIQETMKAGSKIKLNAKRQPAISMSHIRYAYEENGGKIGVELNELKNKMINALTQSKRREHKLTSIISTLSSQLNEALEKIRRYEKEYR